MNCPFWLKILKAGNTGLKYNVNPEEISQKYGSEHSALGLNPITWTIPTNPLCGQTKNLLIHGSLYDYALPAENLQL